MQGLRAFLRREPLLVCWALFALLLALKYTNLVWWLLQLRHHLGAIPGALNHDFVNYWIAGRATLEGNPLLLFEHERYFAHLQSLAGPGAEIRSWSYPPHFLLLLWPLGWLDFFPAYLAFMATTGALFVLAARQLLRTLSPQVPVWQVSVAVSCFAMMMLASTQNGFLSGALMLAALASMHSRPMLAGLALALLSIKPQLGLLFPVLILMDRNWRLLGWTVAWLAVLLAASVIAFGIEPWRQFFANVLPYQALVMRDWNGVFLQMMPGALGGLRSLGVDYRVAVAVQGVFSAAGLVVFIAFLRRHHEPLARAFALTCATFVVAPYAFDYDMGSLAVIAAAFALAHGTGPRWAVVVCGVVAALPAAIQPLGQASLPLSPLLLLAGLAAAATLTRAYPLTRSSR
jgi:hypothetical protein